MIQAGGTFALDDDEVQELLDFLQFTEEDAARLRAYGDYMAPVLSATADALYAHIQTVPALAGILEGHVSACKLKQSTYLKQLIDARVDSLYASLRAYIGVVHWRLRVEPRWYLASYCYLEGMIQSHLLKHSELKDDPDEAFRVMRSLRKLICFDGLVACEAYFHTILSARDSKEQRMEVSSAPAVLDLGRGVVVVPVVGSLDRASGERLHGATLHAFAMGAKTLIVDVERVAGLDAESGEFLLGLLLDLSASESLSVVVAGLGKALERDLARLRLSTRTLTVRPTLAAAVQEAFALEPQKA
jgi:hypothetical protein